MTQLTPRNSKRPMPPVDWEKRAAIIDHELELPEQRTLALEYVEAVSKCVPTKHFMRLKGVTWLDIGPLLRISLRVEALYYEATRMAEILRQRLREEEADRRAVDGVPKPVFHKGKICGEIQEYSDQLLALQLRAGNPERYTERKEVKHSGAVLQLQIDGVRSQGPRTADAIDITEDVEEAPKEEEEDAP